MDELTRRWTEAMRAARFADAWAVEAAVLAARDPATRDDPRVPYHRRWVWDGRAVDGRDVLVRCYHGLGDTIQFARFLPALAARARWVTVEAPARLVPVLAGMADVRFAAFDEAAPLAPREVDVEITELCFALRLAPDAVPAPYLQAAPAVLPAGTVAICHAAGEWDASRSISPDLLAPLCAGGPAITLMPGASTLPVLNPAGCAFDMAATAALVSGAATVVTVDTMIAHLAGALGRPTLLLLKAAPDWRWPVAAARTPWYPTMRLFHQPRAGDWVGAIAAAAAALETMRPDGGTKENDDDGHARAPGHARGAGLLG